MIEMFEKDMFSPMLTQSLETVTNQQSSTVVILKMCLMNSGLKQIIGVKPMLTLHEVP